MTSPAPIAVIGLGNVLLSDDGFGPYAVELLRVGWEMPAAVELIDAGTPGLGLVTYLYDRDLVVLVDAVAATGSPGDLRWYTGEELRTLPPKPRVSPHDPAVQETLLMAQLTGHGPGTVRLIGAIPERTEIGIGLSPGMRTAAASAAALVVRELAACGAVVVPRRDITIPDLWFVRPA